MLRKIVLSLVTFAAFGWLEAPSADAAPAGFSRHNPYTSFNISGVNYGSVRWEQTHGRRTGYHAPHRVLRFRRR